MAAANSLQGVLLGLGNPLLDISADVDAEYLGKYGLQPSNAILCDEKKHLPMYEELANMKGAQYIAGGAAQNTIRVAQWMLQAPGATGYTGCVGNDRFSELLRKAAEGDKVTLHYMVDAKVPTGTCAVCVVDKDRSLVANLSAANHFKVEHLQTPEMTTVLNKAKYFYAEGYFITSGFTSIQHVAKHAVDNNKIMCLNLSAPFLSQFFSEQLLSLIPYVDFLFGNESEALAFGQKQGYKDLSIPAIALEISKMEKKNGSRGRVVVITQGSSATVVATNGTTTTFPVPALDAKLIVDANGAGDAFCGGFLSQLAQGKSIKACVEAGHYAARTILQVSGTVLTGTPSFQESQ